MWTCSLVALSSQPQDATLYLMVRCLRLQLRFSAQAGKEGVWTGYRDLNTVQGLCAAEEGEMNVRLGKQ